jgi:hypothetical protein
MNAKQLAFSFVGPNEADLGDDPKYDIWQCECAEPWKCRHTLYMPWERNYPEVKQVYKNQVRVTSSFCTSKVPASWKLVESAPTFKVYKVD